MQFLEVISDILVNNRNAQHIDTKNFSPTCVFIDNVTVIRKYYGHNNFVPVARG